MIYDFLSCNKSRAKNKHIKIAKIHMYCRNCRLCFVESKKIIFNKSFF